MKVLTPCLAFGAAMLWAAAAGAAVYKCPGPDGRTIFTDKPCPEGEQIHVPTGMVYTPPSAPAAEQETAEEIPEDSPYEYVRIIRPTPEQSLWGTGGTVNIQLDVRPALQAGHQFEVLLDGIRQSLTGTSLNLRLTGIPRGEHSVQVNVVNKAGKSLVSSSRVTFFMHQAAVGTERLPEVGPGTPGGFYPRRMMRPDRPQRATGGPGQPPPYTGQPGQPRIPVPPPPPPSPPPPSSKPSL